VAAIHPAKASNRFVDQFAGAERMRVLDLGCGDGLTPEKLSFPQHWQVVGLDVNCELLLKARLRFPARSFVCSAAEDVPFACCSFDRVVANVSLPYMNISKALTEINRVLVPGGILVASLHPFTFTLSELRQVYKHKPQAALYRLWVLANGILFHLTGRNIGEAFQTERGIRIATSRANFVCVAFRRDSRRWFVEATKLLNGPDQQYYDLQAKSA
jgi:ubiquinone/menaquinone biosynthesis C-methylase UbiE